MIRCAGDRSLSLADTFPVAEAHVPSSEIASDAEILADIRCTPPEWPFDDDDDDHAGRFGKMIGRNGDEDYWMGFRVIFIRWFGAARWRILLRRSLGGLDWWWGCIGKWSVVQGRLLCYRGWVLMMIEFNLHFIIWIIYLVQIIVFLYDPSFLPSRCGK